MMGQVECWDGKATGQQSNWAAQQQGKRVAEQCTAGRTMGQQSNRARVMQQVE